MPGEVYCGIMKDFHFFGNFSTPAVVGLLPKWLDKVGGYFPLKYSGISWWACAFNNGQLTTNAKYYGKIISVFRPYVIKSGDGSQTATWENFLCRKPVNMKALIIMYSRMIETAME